MGTHFLSKMVCKKVMVWTLFCIKFCSVPPPPPLLGRLGGPRFTKSDLFSVIELFLRQTAGAGPGDIRPKESSLYTVLKKLWLLRYPPQHSKRNKKSVPACIKCGLCRRSSAWVSTAHRCTIRTFGVYWCVKSSL